jgi:multicomponent Na+:H+ antiporter subunit F
MLFVEIVTLACLSLLVLRLLLGPTSWDRLLAANSASTRVVTLMAIAAVITNQDVYLDVAVVYATLSFLGIVILSRSIERGMGHR